jgi:hypothetical protein
MSGSIKNYGVRPYREEFTKLNDFSTCKITKSKKNSIWTLEPTDEAKKTQDKKDGFRIGFYGLKFKEIVAQFKKVANESSNESKNEVSRVVHQLKECYLGDRNKSLFSRIFGYNPIKDLEKIDAKKGNFKIGKGPTIAQRIKSIFTTARNWPFSIPERSDKLKHPGTQLRSGDVVNFMASLNEKETLNGKEKKFELLDGLHTGLKGEGFNVNSLTYKEVTTLIEQADSILESNKPLIIPVVFKGDSVIERQHIAVIIIKRDNEGKKCIEYYDPKGVTSSERKLKDGFSMADILLHCQNKFNKGEGEIKENTSVHQLDCNNCGVFVCHRVYELFGKDQDAKKTMIGSFPDKRPSWKEITNFKQTTLCQGINEKTEKEKEKSNRTTSKIVSVGDNKNVKENKNVEENKLEEDFAEIEESSDQE